MDSPFIIGVVIVLAILFVPLIIKGFLTTVDAGSIRVVTKMGGSRSIYKGPGKAIEVPIFTTGTTIPSKAINIDLDIADQTADVDRNGAPRPIKVRVLASAIVSVGDSAEMITTAANKFFSKPLDEQNGILSDLLTSTGRRAINLLNHDELFSAKTQQFGGPEDNIDANTPVGRAVATVPLEEDDRLAIIIKGACSRELQDLGLVFNSLNIKEVQSEVAEARRRQSAVEAKANADIVAADQERRAREAQLAAEQAINDKQRDLEQRRAQNAATIAEAEAQKQNALATQREAELKATQLAQANADAARVRVQAEASAEAEAIKLRTVAGAQADAIRLVNEAIREGGDAYLTLRQLEMLPQIAPVIAQALAQARLVNISSDGARGAAGGATDQITGVIQTVLAAQLVNGAIRTDGASGNGNGSNGAPVAFDPAAAESAPLPTNGPLPKRR